MLVVELGSHDMIIGRNFFDYFHIMIDVHYRQLHWPQEIPPAKTFARTLATYTRDEVRPQRPVYQFQQDMFRRDQAIARNDKRRKDGVHIRLLTHQLSQSLPVKEADVSPKPLGVGNHCLASDLCEPVVVTRSSAKSPNCQFPPIVRINQAPFRPRPRPEAKSKIFGPTWERDTQERLQSMKKELSVSEDDPPPLPKLRHKRPSGKDKVKALPSLNIGLVTANGFRLSTRQEGVEVFSITLDRLTRMIEDQKPDPVPPASKLEVPPYLQYCQEAFSKEQSNVLPPHRSTDYKIELTEENTLGFCHLNKQSVEELTAMRDYLYDNLEKGFIIKSSNILQRKFCSSMGTLWILSSKTCRETEKNVIVK